MFQRKWLLIPLIIIMTACANGSKDGGNVDNNPSALEPPGSEVELNNGTEDNLKEEIPEEAEENSEEEILEEDEEIDITYYMNGIYDMKPIDPADNDKVVLLTFDDGPKDEDTVSHMLDTLDKHEAKAIFFVNGFRVESKPELLIQIHERGHVIGNHSWDHIILRDQTNDTIDQQVEDVQAIVEELIGETPKFFRPPNGAYNDHLKEKVSQEGMLFMNWSNGSRDWESGYRTTEAILDSILEQLRPGSNILMHELQWTVDGLDEILTRLTDEGYSFLHPRAIHLEQGNPTEADQP